MPIIGVMHKYFHRHIKEEKGEHLLTIAPWYLKTYSWVSVGEWGGGINIINYFGQTIFQD